MARSVSWLPRLHEIRRSVENSVRSHYDRRDLELLFKLQPRAAGKLINLLRTGSTLGSSYLVERDTLLKFLVDAGEAEDIGTLCLRQRLEQQQIAHRRRPRSLVRRDLDPVGLAALPNWITIERGRLCFDFETTEQLAEGMLILARIFESDGDEFASTYEPKKQSSDAPAAAAEVHELFDELERMESNHGR